MRITGGESRGRTLKVPHGDRVRPTQDRVREALFSMLLAELPGARFLDLFAGTGSVGIEAFGRGASDVVWVEGDRAVWRVTFENVSAIAGEGMHVVCADVFRWIRGPGRHQAFDIVFADPPYVQARNSGLKELADELTKSDTVAPSGLFITEMPTAAPVEAWDGWDVLRDRTYGQTRLVIRQRKNAQTV